MQVILRQNVPSLGRRGEVKNVKDGYFQNYLLPRKLAEIASPVKIKEAEQMLKRQLVEKERIKEQAVEIAVKMKELKITLKAKAKGDKLYGSIKEEDVLKAIEEKLNVRLDKHHLVLSGPIKVAGSYEVPVHLSEGVDAKFLLEVKGEK